MESQADTNLAASFEKGVDCYFKDFGHRLAREAPHQAWLLMSVAKFISPQLIVAELQTPQQDLAHLVNLAGTRGAYNYDFAITRSEIDLRTWKYRTPGWKSGVSSLPQTLETLSQLAVVAEFKVAASSSTSLGAIRRDIRKLTALYHFLQQQNVQTTPTCYMVIFDAERRINAERLIRDADEGWLNGAPKPTILLGP